MFHIMTRLFAATMLLVVFTACSNSGDDKPVVERLTNGRVIVHGPIVNANYQITNLSDENHPLVAQGTTSSDNAVIARTGRINVKPGLFIDSNLYLVTVSGGGDIDHDMDGELDNTATSVQAPLRLIIRGDQIKSLNWMVSPLSELVFQALNPFIGATDNLDFVNTQLEILAQRILVDEVNCPQSDCIGYDDVVAWLPDEDRSYYKRGIENYDAFSAQLVNGGPLSTLQLGDSIGNASYTPNPLASEQQQAATYALLRLQMANEQLAVRNTANNIDQSAYAAYTSVFKFTVVDAFGIARPLLLFYGNAPGYAIADASRPEALQPLMNDTLGNSEVDQVAVTQSDDQIYLAVEHGGDNLKLYLITNVLTAGAQAQLVDSLTLTSPGKLVAAFPIVMNVSTELDFQNLYIVEDPLEGISAKELYYSNADPAQFTATAVALRRSGADQYDSPLAEMFLAHSTGVQRVDLRMYQGPCLPGGCSIDSLEITAQTNMTAPSNLQDLLFYASADGLLGIGSSSLYSMSLTNSEISVDDTLNRNVSNLAIDGDRAIAVETQSARKQIIELSLSAFPSVAVTGEPISTDATDIEFNSGVIITTQASSAPVSSQIATQDSAVVDTPVAEFNVPIANDVYLLNNTDTFFIVDPNSHTSTPFDTSAALIGTPYNYEFIYVTDSHGFAINSGTCTLEVVDLATNTLVSNSLFIGCEPSYVGERDGDIEIVAIRQVSDPTDRTLVEVDISSPDAPSVVSAVRLPANCFDACTFVTIAPEPGGIRVLDQYFFVDNYALYPSELDSGTLSAYYYFSGYLADTAPSKRGIVATNGDYLYISDLGSNLLIYAIEPGQRPEQLPSIAANGAKNIYVNDSFLFAADGLAGISVYGLLTPEAPFLLARLNFNDDIIDMRFTDDSLFAISTTAIYAIPRLAFFQ